ncbi:MAG TPA: lactate utilization protein [Bryobacteraceae bacterium]|nr:lactate utilization protein [Bryobacteraceae bacterium]
MSREQMLQKVRTALGRSPGQPAAPPPPVWSRIPQWTAAERVERFSRAVEALGGKPVTVENLDAARRTVEQLMAGHRAIASNAPLLTACGITSLPGVESGFTDAAAMRPVCASVAIGITSADYALADTGTLVMLSSPSEARLVSLLPPTHIAVIPESCIVANLDELLSILPKPAEQSSSMVLITGPSRTADIEQILVRGVHGPGELYVIILSE